jgi:hypothetical protein
MAASMITREVPMIVRLINRKCPTTDIKMIIRAIAKISVQIIATITMSLLWTTIPMVDRIPARTSPFVKMTTGNFTCPCMIHG